jgi:hypothetical protein
MAARYMGQMLSMARVVPPSPKLYGFVKPPILPTLPSRVGLPLLRVIFQLPFVAIIPK